MTTCNFNQTYWKEDGVYEGLIEVEKCSELQNKDKNIYDGTEVLSLNVLFGRDGMYEVPI